MPRDGAIIFGDLVGKVPLALKWRAVHFFRRPLLVPSEVPSTNAFCRTAPSERRSLRAICRAGSNSWPAASLALATEPAC
jgi:hypothetical protein